MTDSKGPSAIGVFNDLDSAERKIDELKRAGFSEDEVGIIGHVGQGQNETVPTPLEMHEPEDNAIAGLIRGAIIGAIAGAFVILVMPGIGEVAGLGRWFDVLGGAILTRGDVWGSGRICQLRLHAAKDAPICQCPGERAIYRHGEEPCPARRSCFGAAPTQRPGALIQKWVLATGETRMQHG